MGKKKTINYKHPYYNFDKLFSYNGVINIVAGGRGIGKTYGIKAKIIRAGIERGEQFIFMRRYREELQATMKTFMADVGHLWPEYDFRVEQKELQYAHVSTKDEKPREWRTIGFFIPLSIAQNYKSTAFPEVRTIVMDEFIKETSSPSPYLRKEADALVNFFFTVDRGQDRTRLVMLANAVTIDNPYFISWKIRPDQESEWVIKDKGFIVAHFPDSDLFQMSIYSTRFGQWIKGSEYADYAVGNNFSDNTEELMEEKAPTAKAKYNIETETGTFCLWFDAMPGKWYVTRKLARLDKTVTLDTHRMGDGKVVWTHSDPRMQILRRAFHTGRMYFDDPHSRNAFMEVFKR